MGSLCHAGICVFVTLPLKPLNPWTYRNLHRNLFYTSHSLSPGKIRLARMLSHYLKTDKQAGHGLPHFTFDATCKLGLVVDLYWHRSTESGVTTFEIQKLWLILSLTTLLIFVFARHGEAGGGLAIDNRIYYNCFRWYFGSALPVLDKELAGKKL